MNIEDLKKRARDGDRLALQALRDLGFFEGEKKSTEGFVLSNAQRRLWIIDQMSGAGGPAYNMAGALRLEGHLDVEAFDKALREIVERHESLRTTFFTIDGHPRQKIHEASQFSLERIDLRHLDRPEDAARNIGHNHATRAFDLERGPLFRTALLHVSDAETGHNPCHVFLFNLHHIICDEWSIGILIDELANLYRTFADGQPSTLIPLQLQYRDFAARQYQQLQGESGTLHRRYWIEKFDGDITPLDLTTDQPRPTFQTFDGDAVSTHLDPHTAHGLRQISRDMGVSLYVTLLSLVKALFHRYSGQQDLTIGCPAAGRTTHDLEGQIGFYINTLALRDTIIPSDSFAQIIAKVRQTVADGFEHQMYPFESLLDDLQLNRDLSRSPLFDTMVVLEDDRQVSLDLEGLKVDQFDTGIVQAKFDFVFEFSDEGETIALRLVFNRNLYAGERVRALVKHLENLALAVTGEPDTQICDLALTDAEERRQLVEIWNQTGSKYPSNTTIHELFEQQVQTTPAAVAVTMQDTAWTYECLNCEAEAIAKSLCLRGIRPDELVGLYSHRSPHTLAGLLGILKAGGAYVPLDPDYPVDRLRFMIEDSKARTILVSDALLPRLESMLAAIGMVDPPALIRLDHKDQNASDELSTGDSSALVGPTNLAYCMYTSGSTGRPKGTLISHRAVIRLVRDTGFMDFTDQTFLQFAPISFDASTLEMWGPLLNGGKLVIMPPDLPSLEDLGSVIRTQGITTLWLTAGVFHLMVDERLDDLGGLNQLLAGGDVLSLSHAAKMKRQHPHCRLINGYGPTENTTFTCCYEIPADLTSRKSVPIGRPIANTRVYIVDERLEIVPIGVPGELLAAGDGLAQGYLNQPDLTRDSFIQNPVTGRADDLVYRTGDLARWLPDGNIEFLGRLDQQAKVRGFRVEPGELESVLNEHDLVRDAVAVVRSSPGDGKQLLAYIVSDDSESDREKFLRQLRIDLRERLPDYMIPTAITCLDRFPLSANGKVDRDALPDPSLASDSSTSFVPTEGVIEEQLAAIWRDLLGVGRVGAEDLFLDLGGNSIKAILLVGRILKEMHTKVHIREVFEKQTVRQLAAVISGRDMHNATPIKPIPDAPHYDVSNAQRRLWIIDRMGVDRAAYNIASMTRLRGHLDTEALEHALVQLAERHESLRTHFTEIDGEPRQIVEQAIDSFYAFTDVSDGPDPDGKAKEQAIAEAGREFDLARTPLFRVTLVRICDDEHLLTFNMHHIISDGWSIDLIVRELLDLYITAMLGQDSWLAPLRIQYRDYAEWQLERLRGEQMEQEKRYWQELFSDEIPILELPTDQPRPAAQSFRGAVARLVLPADASKALHDMAQQHQVSHFVTCVTVIKILLHRYSGSEDIVVGAPIAGRDHPDLNDQVGFFVNMLALRDPMTGTDTVTDVVGRVRTTVEGALDRSSYPFDMLVEDLDLDRDMGRNPLFDVVVSFREAQDAASAIPDLKIEPVTFEPGTSKFDLTFFFGQDEAGSIGLDVEYSTDLFHADRIHRLLQHLCELIPAMARSPAHAVSSLQIMSESERAQVLAASRPPASDYPRDKTIVALFEELAHRRPDNAATVCPALHFSYRQLNSLANQVATAMLDRVALRSEESVAILMDRSVWTAVATLAVLKTGCAYLPLDTKDPAERLAFIIGETGCRLALTSGQSNTLGSSCPTLVTIDLTSLSLDAEDESPDPAPRGTDTSLAYIMYTSGSTGQPKGVKIEQKSVIRLVRNTNYIQLTEQDRTLQAGSLAFDASTFEIWGALLNGGCVCFPREGDILEPALLGGAIREFRVTTMFITTSLFNQLVEADATILGGLVRVLTGGEKVSPQHVIAARDANPGLEVLSAYGPTENTTFTTWHRIQGTYTGDIPLGRPIANTTVYVMNDSLQLCPIGIPGEICTGGDGVARGYIARPELMQERFVTAPFAEDDLLYRTGDIGVWDVDGTLSFLGRVDDQVKIRGFRIEPGDVEHHLRQVPGVSDACVLSRPTTSGTLELVGYYTGEHLEALQVRDFLGRRIPHYMVPSHVVHVEQFPLNRSGKVDRKALRLLEIISTRAYEPPVTPVDRAVAGVVAQVLGAPQVGLTDSFFELGGDSIRAIQVVSRLRQEDLTLQVKDLFQASDIRDLAGRVVTGVHAPEAKEFSGKVFLTAIQQWFFDEHEHDLHHFNQTVLLKCSAALDVTKVRDVIEELHRHHDMLRATFRHTSGGWVQEVRETAVISVESVDLRQATAPVTVLEEHASQTQASFDLAAGPLMKSIHYRLPDGDRLLIVIHHLLCDGVTWRILLEDLEAGYRQACDGHSVVFAPRTTSYLDWSNGQRQFAMSEEFHEDMKFWHKAQETLSSEIPVDGDPAQIDNVYRQSESVEIILSEVETQTFLSQPQRAYRADSESTLLAALGRALGDWHQGDATRILVESHGREAMCDDQDLTRTVGWFTSIYPFILHADHDDYRQAIRVTKEDLRRIPRRGVSHGVSRYVATPPLPSSSPKPALVFNYLGQFDEPSAENQESEGLFCFAEESTGSMFGPRFQRQGLLEFTGIIVGRKLRLSVTYHPQVHHATTIESFLKSIRQQLLALLDHCVDTTATEKTPTDFTDCPLGLPDYDTFLAVSKRRAAEVDDVYPLSPMQSGLLYQELLDPDATAYFVQMSFTLRGALDVDRFRTAWEHVVERHTVLRTAFVQDGVPEPIQLVHKHRPPEFHHADLCTSSSPAQDEEIAEFSTRDMERSFDLQANTLMRFAIFRIESDLHRVVWSYHHILLDGWSLGNVFGEFSSLYEAHHRTQHSLLPPARPYSRHIEWLQDHDAGRAHEFWRDRLEGVEQLTSIPTQPGADPQAAYRMGELTFQLSETQGRSLQDVAHQAGATLSTLIQTGWAVVLSRYQETGDILFGSIVSGRPAEVDHIEQMVGLFINAIPVRIRVDEEQAFIDLLKIVQEQALEAEPYHYCPLPEIQALTSLQQGLFDHLFIFENFPTDRAALATDGGAGLAIEDVVSHDETHYPFNLVVVPDELIEFRLTYDVGTYPTQQIQQVRDHLLSALACIVQTPTIPVSQIQILSDAERHQLHQFQGEIEVEPASPISTALDLFHEQVGNFPTLTALIVGDREMTYEALNQRANQLARYLIAQSTIDLDTPVGIMIDRSERMVIAVLGVLKAGLAYLPLDTSEPEERVLFMLSDADVGIVLTDSATDLSLPELANTQLVHLDQLDSQIRILDNSNLDQGPCAADAAYVIYTSGSTGEPKGCVVEHRNLSHYLTWAASHYFLDDDSGHFGLFSPLSFDLTITSLFLPLIRGNSLTIYSSDIETQDIFADMLSPASRVDSIKLTPSHISLIRESGLAGPTNVQLVIVGGEALGADQVAYLHELKPTLRVFNEYGPTETTVGCVVCEIAEGTSHVVIGKPITGMRIRVLDAQMRPTPIGVTGEIYISGAGVSRGYLNREVLNAERFLDSPFEQDERLYRSGDLGRWLPDGELEFLGRCDDQVKIRGFRIEPGEIERALQDHAQVDQATVITTADSELVAYVVGDVISDELRGWLLHRLPGHMVPTWFIPIDEIPLTVNGKLDRHALPDPTDARLERRNAEREGPRDELEQRVWDIWTSVLQVENIGIHDSFYDLGGHSLKATQIVSRVLLTMHVKLSLREFLQTPTVAGLADRIRTDSGRDTLWPIQPAARQEAYDLSHAQRRLWLIDRLGDGASYNIPQAYRIRGDFDATILSETLSQIVERHESLRTVFIEIDGEPRQRILDALPLDVQQIDLTTQADPVGAAREIVEHEAILPFNLAKPPLMRVKLVKVSDKDSVFIINMHHIIGDGWSMNILFREMMELFDALFSGVPSTLVPLPIQYKDFSEWQNGQSFDTEERYWLKQLAGTPTGVLLPFDFPQTQDRDFKGALETRQIGGDSLAALRRLASSKQVTLADLLLAIFKLFLFRLTKQEDLCVGVSIANRNHPDLEHLIGFFVNILPIRTTMSSDMDFNTLLDRVSQVAREAYDHQSYPFDRMVEMLNPDRIANRQPLVNVLYAFQNYSDVRLDIATQRPSAAANETGLHIEPFTFSFNTSKVDLTLFAFDDSDQIHLHMEYDTGLFRSETIGKYLETYIRFASMIGDVTPSARGNS